MRLLTLLCLAAAAVAGSHLYQERHEVELMQRDLRATQQAMREVRDRTRVLQAEWMLLNEPGRVKSLAEGLRPDLRPMHPTQAVRMEEAIRRLPPPTLSGKAAGAGAASPAGIPIADPSNSAPR